MNYHDELSSFFSTYQLIPDTDRTAYTYAAEFYIAQMISKFCTPRENEPDYVPLPREFIIRQCVERVKTSTIYSNYDNTVWYGYSTRPLITRIKHFIEHINMMISWMVTQQLHNRTRDSREWIPTNPEPQIKELGEENYSKKRSGHRRDFEKIQRKKGLVDSNKTTRRKEAQYKHERELIECF